MTYISIFVCANSWVESYTNREGIHQNLAALRRVLDGMMTLEANQECIVTSSYMSRTTFN
jgi:hypothetical protein